MLDTSISIRQNEFMGLQEGDRVVDRHGREWTCYGRRRARQIHGDLVLLQCPGYGRRPNDDGFYWQEGKIFCEDWNEGPCISMDFSGPSARIIKKGG